MNRRNFIMRTALGIAALFLPACFVEQYKPPLMDFEEPPEEDSHQPQEHIFNVAESGLYEINYADSYGNRCRFYTQLRGGVPLEYRMIGKLKGDN